MKISAKYFKTNDIIVNTHGYLDEYYLLECDVDKSGRSFSRFGGRYCLHLQG
jgi:hypothetical protein